MNKEPTPLWGLIIITFFIVAIGEELVRCAHYLKYMSWYMLVPFYGFLLVELISILFIFHEWIYFFRRNKS